MRERSRKKTTEEFIEECRAIYGDTFDYSSVSYQGNKVAVTIICPKHGEVRVIPVNFLKGRGCPKCNREHIKKEVFNTESFIAKAKERHGVKYDYSKVEYESTKKQVVIICPTHGEFLQTPNDHLNGCGCKQCELERVTKSQEEFLLDCRNRFDGKYICEKTQYINNDTKTTFYCEKHGYFEAYPRQFLTSDGCPKCKYESWLKSLDSFIEDSRKVHGNKYDYSKAEYKGAFRPLEIICHEKDRFGNEHGSFWQTPNHHTRGHGCPKCIETKLEEEVRVFLENNEIDFEKYKKFDWLKNKNCLSLDFYLPQYNIAIECQGIQHFQSVEYFGGEKIFGYVKECDSIKQTLCEEHGIKILYYSKLGIDYPYKVYEDLELLYQAIKYE